MPIGLFYYWNCINYNIFQMITSKQCLEKFGDPYLYEPQLVLWDVPKDLEIGIIPKKIYCNQLMVEPLTLAFINLVSRGYAEQLKTYDGCWNIRAMKGKTKLWSLHSWAIAIDFDASLNQFRKEPTMDLGMVQCFIDAGFDWGGFFKVPDGMHFQLKYI